MKQRFIAGLLCFIMLFSSQGTIYAAEHAGAKVVEAKETIKTATVSNDYELVLDGTVVTGYTGTPVNLVIPEGITEIGMQAFMDCETLETVQLPSTLKKINKHGFLGCGELKEIKFSEGLEHLYDYAFGMCTKLEEVTLPESLVSIGEFGFNHCSNLKRLIVPGMTTNLVYGYNELKELHKDFVLLCWPNSVMEKTANRCDINYDYIPYKVSFDANGGITNETEREVKPSQKIGTLPEVERVGYEFLGWYTQDEALVTADTVINSDMTVIAKWDIMDYTITYNLNGGQQTITNVTSYNVLTDTITLNNPTKKGYYFDGWYAEEDYTNKVTEIAKGSTGNMTLYAKWSANKYYIEYKGNGATSGSMKNGTYAYGNTYNLTANVFKKSGYTFIGWNTKADGSGRTYKDKESIKNLTTTDSKTITLYAQWKKDTYTITYQLNGGKNSSKNPSTYTYTTDTITLQNPSRKGYVFGGWFTDSKLTNKVTKISKGSTGNKTFYAKWTAIQYSVAFDGNGNDSGSMKKLTGIKYDKSFTLTSNVFKKKGYTFVGWNTQKDGKGISYDNKEIVKNLTSTNGKTVTLYAQWSKTKYTITYKLNGGKNSSKNPTVYTIATSTITLKAPSRKGYEFGGWYSDSKLKNKVTKISKGSTGNKTFYAKWTPIKYKVAYVGNGATSGNMDKQTSAKYDKAVTLKTNAFKKNGYTFTGWNTAKDGSGTTYKDKASVKNLASTDGKTVKLYAQWKANKYYVKFVANNDDVTGSMSKKTYTYGKKYTLPKNTFTHNSGFQFLGWNTKANGKGTTYKDAASIKNLTAKNKGTITLYAMWGIEAPKITSITKLSYEKLRVRLDSVDGADGYIIYRSTSKNGTYKKVGTDKLWYDDSGLNANTTYYYKVRAYAETPSGNKIYSEYSKPVKGTTAKRPSFEARAKANFGNYVSIVHLEFYNKGDERLTIGGSDVLNFCSYYPYDGAYDTDGIIVNSSMQELSGVYFDPGVRGSVMFRLDHERYTTDTASIAFCFIYDECEYVGVAYANGMISFKPTDCVHPDE